jgi:hypothetical protein
MINKFIIVIEQFDGESIDYLEDLCHCIQGHGLLVFDTIETASRYQEKYEINGKIIEI